MHPLIHPAIVVASALGALIVCLLVVRYGLATSSEADPEVAARNRVIVRVGHAAAAGCFAVTAMLGTVALVHQGRAPAPTVPATVERSLADLTTQARATEQRVAAMEATLARVDGRITARDTRLTDVERRLDRSLKEREARSAGETQAVETRQMVETRMKAAEAQVGGLEATVRKLAADVTRTATRLRQVERKLAGAEREPAQVAARPAAPTPAAPSPPLPAADPPSELGPQAADARSPAPPASPPAPSARPRVEPRPAPESAAADVPLNLREKMREDWKVIREGFRETGADIRNFWNRVTGRAGEGVNGERHSR
jgi:hypothetical protein